MVSILENPTCNILVVKYSLIVVQSYGMKNLKISEFISITGNVLTNFYILAKIQTLTEIKLVQT